MTAITWRETCVEAEALLTPEQRDMVRARRAERARIRLALIDKFDPDQPRDESGKWSSGGGGGGGGGSTLPSPPPASGPVHTPTTGQIGTGGDKNPTQPEKWAIDTYTWERPYMWTHYLRTGDKTGGEMGEGMDPIGDKDLKQMKTLDAFLERQSFPENTVVYRGVSPEYGKTLVTLKVGEEIEDKGYMSTSKVERVAREDFATRPGSAMMRIAVPKGAKAADITDHSYWTDQEEVLMARGSRMVLRAKSGNIYDFDLIT